jgi:hypothetical protein
LPFVTREALRYDGERTRKEAAMRLLDRTWWKMSSTVAAWLLLLTGGAPPVQPEDQPKPLYGVVAPEPLPPQPKPVPPTDDPDVVPEEPDEEKETPCVYGPPPEEAPEPLPEPSPEK